MRPLYLLAVIAVLIPMLVGCEQGAPDVTGGPPTMRRITAEQYTNSVADVFGPDVIVAGRFEPESRRAGLNAVGTSLVSVSPSGFEQYEAIARGIAAQVVSEERREALLSCQPQQADAADDACTAEIVDRYGRLLLRRPLTEQEVEVRVAAAAATAGEVSNFYAGLELALSSLLVAPDFLFRIEEIDPGSLQAQRANLSDLTLASRLSFFFWNRGPDEALLAAAERGELSETVDLERQVDRLLASDKLAGGVRAFFDDLFLFDLFDDINKDVAIYPLYNQRLATDAREQTLRFVVDQLVQKRADYRDLFTSRDVPMSRTLGPLYGVPVRTQHDWEDAQFSPRESRAGLLSHASFAMLHAHPGRSSPTLRGVFLREALLCQTIPEAPADVDFALFSEDSSVEHKTARERLDIHSTEPSCNKCHVLTDPIGLGLEVFDGIGRFRTTENGADIDTAGDLDGRDFGDPVELGQAFAEEPLVSACLVQKLYRYAVGREELLRERRLIRHLEDRFEELQYKVPALMREIALSDGFRTASPPAADEAQEGVATTGSEALDTVSTDISEETI